VRSSATCSESSQFSLLSLMGRLGRLGLRSSVLRSHPILRRWALRVNRAVAAPSRRASRTTHSGFLSGTPAARTTVVILPSCSCGSVLPLAVRCQFPIFNSPSTCTVIFTVFGCSCFGSSSGAGWFLCVSSSHWASFSPSSSFIASTFRTLSSSHGWSVFLSVCQCSHRQFCHSCPVCLRALVFAQLVNAQPFPDSQRFGLSISRDCDLFFLRGSCL
jgi:hypothetical protein